MVQTASTNAAPRTALVLGATGGIGGAIAARLIRDGWQVRALCREADSAVSGWRHACPAPHFVAGDAMDQAAVVRAATLGDGVAVIVHAVNPRGYRHWSSLVLPMMDNTLAAARAAGGARIVLPGTVYNYDPAHTAVIDENTPQNACTRKGRVRIALERKLAEAAPQLPSLIVRAGDFFGPAARASWFAQAMVKPGQPVRTFTSMAPGVPHAYAYLPDLAAAFAGLLAIPERLRPHERVQFAGQWDATGTQMRDAVRRVVGEDLPERAFPWWMMRLAAPFGGFPREALEIEPVWKHPMRLDNRRLVDLLGTEPHTPLDHAIAATLADMGCLGRSPHAADFPSV
ncbi:NAD(P)H-binding protein [Ancylobacter dichloromethanicus]|uniref:Epimerase n=1 Tax=Ancylobacter dichloromethanicus TaxID=518825 RepID=A0A9W6J7C0_9HYPH|nr:NAD-dependent epimerase/dehydratase family protein [Ancylobacter dichloromethanicus]MBS7552801.1 NAD(P)H-binding protein [Ancylobacter dichloromethanicus]GLK72165.1 epimerase [Ancylobacter dichloromethanicus]